MRRYSNRLYNICLNMKKYIIIIFIVIIIINIGGSISAANMELHYKHRFNNINKYKNYDLENERLYMTEFSVRGIYVSGWVAGTEDKMDYLIDIVDRTILNTM